MHRLALLALVAACSDGETATPPADAPPAPPDAAAAQCLVPATYGDLGAKTGTTAQGPTTLTIVLDPGPPRDSFFLKLAAGKGVFTGGLATGTYPITADEADFNACGLCVNIIADIVAGQGPSKFYFATSGSVTLTATEPPAGTLANVTLEEVTVAGAPAGSGCATTITAMSFGP